MNAAAWKRVNLGHSEPKQIWRLKCPQHAQKAASVSSSGKVLWWNIIYHKQRMISIQITMIVSNWLQSKWSKQKCSWNYCKSSLWHQILSAGCCCSVCKSGSLSAAKTGASSLNERVRRRFPPLLTSSTSQRTRCKSGQAGGNASF